MARRTFSISPDGSGENINFFIGKRRGRLGAGPIIVKNAERRSGPTVTKMFGRAGTLPNVDKRDTRTVHAIQSVFPSLPASVSRNWLRTLYSDLLQSARLRSALLLFFTSGRLAVRLFAGAECRRAVISVSSEPCI